MSSSRARRGSALTPWPVEVAPEKAGEVEARFAAAELSVWQIGEVVKGEGVEVLP